MEHPIDVAISRRKLLLATTALIALSGCTQPGSPALRGENLVSQVLENKLFYIAHRGSGDNWTEHTAESYSRSISGGATAIEVSVHRTADGVLVCHHDPNTLRLTGRDLEISDTSFEDLQVLRNDARRWLGPKSQLQPIPRLVDVLDAHAQSKLIFIEDKTGKNLDPIVALMKKYRNPEEHFIWKQPADSPDHLRMAPLGFKTWGYFSPSLFDQFENLSQNFDLVGIHHSATDSQVKELVKLGIPVICWEVHNRSMRERMIRLGVNIMMCSNTEYVMTDQARNDKDAFSTGLRAPGDLPWTLDRGWAAQPTIQTEGRSILLDDPDFSSYQMGSMCPIAAESYTLNFGMRWPTEWLDVTQHAGMAFGQDSDAPYRVQRTSQVGGYHLIVRPSGEVALYRRAASEITGTKISSVLTAPPAAGQWMEFSIRVSPVDIEFTRTDINAPRGVAADVSYRGGYFSLCKNYSGGPPVEFRGVFVTRS